MGGDAGAGDCDCACVGDSADSQSDSRTGDGAMALAAEQGQDLPASQRSWEATPANTGEASTAAATITENLRAGILFLPLE